MPTPRLAPEKVAEILRLRAEGLTIVEIARRVGVNPGTAEKYAASAVAPRPHMRAPAPPDDTGTVPLIEEMLRERGQDRPSHPASAAAPAGFEAVAAALRRHGLTVDQIRDRSGESAERVDAWLKDQADRGVNLRREGDLIRVERTTPVGGNVVEVKSRPDGTFKFGICSDQHLGSKYERLDVLNDLYDRFAAEGCQAVLNAGNWIDGEARFNVHDLKARGMGGQLAYLAEHYPRRPGLVTYAVAGDDHEGWYGQREGVDIGRWAERAMLDAGRDDWKYIGFIEGHVRLIHATSGQSAICTVMHPGGGSAYAVSYQPQKIVESLEGGSKPAVLILGHYHKLSVNNIRNVWTVQSGATQDQTVFMRKKRIDAHVGGGILTLHQDPRTGAIPRCLFDMLRYFDRSYYTTGRWSYDGPVALPERSVEPR